MTGSAGMILEMPLKWPFRLSQLRVDSRGSYPSQCLPRPVRDLRSNADDDLGPRDDGTRYPCARTSIFRTNQLSVEARTQLERRQWVLQSRGRYAILAFLSHFSAILKATVIALAEILKTRIDPGNVK